MTELPKFFNSWLEVYQFIKKNNLADEQRISLLYPPHESPRLPDQDTTSEMVTLMLDEVKARAFDEINERLPKPETISTLVELLESATPKLGKRNTAPVMEFLNKLPTRS